MVVLEPDKLSPEEKEELLKQAGEFALAGLFWSRFFVPGLCPSALYRSSPDLTSHTRGISQAVVTERKWVGWEALVTDLKSAGPKRPVGVRFPLPAPRDPSLYAASTHQFGLLSFAAVVPSDAKGAVSGAKPAILSARARSNIATAARWSALLTMA